MVQFFMKHGVVYR